MQQSFNKSLNSWNVSKVTNLKKMFFNASSFNQPLDNWVLSPQLTKLEYVFQEAK